MSDSDSPDSPKLPTTSGGPLYIAAAAVLLAAIGGVVFWKTRDTNEPKEPPPAPSIAAPAPSAAPPPTILDSIPPPPPVEEVAEPTPEPSKAAPGAKGPGYDPCAGPCKGSASPGLTQALSARAASSRSCYERALQTNEGLQGKLVVQVRVDPTGRVCSSKLAEDGIGSQTVSSCVLGTFRGAKLPPPAGGCLDVNVPMSFVSRGGK